MLSPVLNNVDTLWKRIRGHKRAAVGGEAPTTIRALIESLLPLAGKHLVRKRELDRGGMGAIEIVEDESLQRRVARKIVHHQFQDSAWMVGSFIREAQITAQLEHPHIVPVHDIGRTEDGRVCFTMRLIQGRSLIDLIEGMPGGIASGEGLLDLLDVMVKVCDALALAHSRGVVHCDIKPQNVLTGGFGEVYLMDWGISRVQDDDELPVLSKGAKSRVHTTISDDGEGVMMGTPAYMSPEQARGRKPGSGSDIFSVGAVIYHIVTGRAPYLGDSATNVVERAKQCRFESPVTVAGSAVVPLELNRIILKAMAQRPADRYAHVSDLKADLVRFMRGGGDFPREAFCEGEHIVRQGDVGDSAYVIISGSCEVYKRVDGRKVMLKTMGAGEAFGETAILAATTRTASVQCKEDTVVMVINRHTLEEEVDHMKPWMGAIIRTLTLQARHSVV